MTIDRIRYRSGYKYRLVKDWQYETGWRVSCGIQTAFIELSAAGVLRARAGYAWDGPSGPTIDTPDLLIASLPHDMGYQLIREGHLAADLWRRRFDDLFIRVYREAAAELQRRRGWLWRTLNAPLISARAAWCHLGVRVGGGASVRPEASPVLEAP